MTMMASFVFFVSPQKKRRNETQKPKPKVEENHVSAHALSPFWLPSSHHAHLYIPSPSPSSLSSSFCEPCGLLPRSVASVAAAAEGLGLPPSTAVPKLTDCEHQGINVWIVLKSFFCVMLLSIYFESSPALSCRTSIVFSSYLQVISQIELRAFNAYLSVHRLTRSQSE